MTTIINNTIETLYVPYDLRKLFKSIVWNQLVSAAEEKPEVIADGDICLSETVLRWHHGNLARIPKSDHSMESNYYTPIVYRLSRLCYTIACDKFLAIDRKVLVFIGHRSEFPNEWCYWEYIGTLLRKKGYTVTFSGILMEVAW